MYKSKVSIDGGKKILDLTNIALSRIYPAPRSKEAKQKLCESHLVKRSLICSYIQIAIFNIELTRLCEVFMQNG